MDARFGAPTQGRPYSSLGARLCAERIRRAVAAAIAFADRDTPPPDAVTMSWLIAQ